MSGKKWLGWMYLLALAATAVLFAVKVWDPSPLKILRQKQFDIYQQMWPRPVGAAPVTIIDIDEASLDVYGQWPWSRALLADLVDALRAQGTAVIGFDIVFPEADRLSGENVARDMRGLDAATRETLRVLPSNDALFAQSFRDAKVVLGQSVTPEIQPGSATGEARKSSLAWGGPKPLNSLFNFKGVIRNIPLLERNAAGLGVFTAPPELDGISRRVPTFLRVGEQVFPSLVVEILRVFLGEKTLTVMSNESGVERLVVGEHVIPTDINGLTWLHFNRGAAKRYVSVKDVLEDRLPPDRLRGHVVLVGTSAIGLFDIKATPLGEPMPGVEVEAQWLESALSGALLNRSSDMIVAERAATIVICLILSLIVPLVGVGISLLVGLGSVAGLVGLSLFLFTQQGTLMGIAYPALAGFALYTFLILMNYLREERQRRQVRTAFSHYLSPDLVKQIADDPTKLSLSGENRELTFLFTDIAGFTSLVEGLGPETLVRLLNGYLDGACQIVMDKGGTIDKIVGDAVHAMFGAPNEQADHASRAVACALEIDAFAFRFTTQCADEGIKFGITRIGVNTGVAAVGNFGGSSRFDYTAHGDAINTAARMESVNKHLGTRICISGTTVEKCPEVPVRPIAELILEGKSFAMATFEPIPGEDVGSPRVIAYEAAYAAMRDEAPEAAASFAALAREYPDDPLIHLHAGRLANGELGAVMKTSK